MENERDDANNARPTYENDKALFAQFLRDHTIQVAVSDDDDLDEDANDDDTRSMFDEGVDIPGAFNGPQLRRIPCFRYHLQRIKDRRFYSDSSKGNNNGNNNSNNNNNTFIMEVPLSELVAWNAVPGSELATKVAHNTLRYASIFAEALDEYLDQHLTTSDRSTAARDTIDILHEQRRLQMQQQQQQQPQQNPQNPNENNNPYNNGNNTNNNNNNNDNNVLDPVGGMQEEEDQQQKKKNAASMELPSILTRRYELRILPLGRRGVFPPFCHQHVSAHNPSNYYATLPTAVSLRHIRANSIGKLVTVTGLLVRCSDVKPACVVATYACDHCGIEAYQLVQQQREYLPATTCPNCHSKNSTLHWQSRGSKLISFQECKLQELPNQVPMGHVPRSVRVLCRGSLTRQALPGDVVTMDAVFLPQRLAESGYKALNAGLIATTFLEAQNIVAHKKSFDEPLQQRRNKDEEQDALEAQLLQVATSNDPVGRLARSLAPEIFGHADVKRALLLQLVGGCTRTLPDGMRIRGDINVCLMGDPGVAKSQLLKHVASIAPRGVYTTGKGSSGVGLTAAITKDMATSELALEGGALVLADRGICCIDEFDKMDESDRTAIHEVMEQQTVSIAKAGIVATLNARTAVLAAANPLYGRYNRKKSLSENINLPNSLLSRFDLLFLILDVADVDQDTALARHVTWVHRMEGRNNQKKKMRSKGQEQDDQDDEDEMAKQQDKDIVPPAVLRAYISRARQHQPVLSPEVAPYVVEAYVSLRQQDHGRKNGNGDQTVMTARQLLSILRLSQALARLRFSDYVAREDVDEAIRLTHQSKSSLLDQDDGSKKKQGGAGGQDVLSRIYNILRDYASVSTTNREIELQLAEAMVLRKGFTTQQLQSCLEEYESLQVIQINQTRTHVFFVD